MAHGKPLIVAGTKPECAARPGVPASFTALYPEKDGCLEVCRKGGARLSLSMELASTLWFVGPPLSHSNSPRPPCFGLILPALNPKVISKGQPIRASRLSGKERCFCGEATGLWVSEAGLGFGGRGAGGWAGSRPWKCSDGPAAGRRATALSSGEPFLPGRKHCVHSAPN